MENFEPLLKTEQAAHLLGIHPKTLQKLAREGNLPATRIDDLWRFRATELGLWLRSAVSSTPPLVSSNEKTPICLGEYDTNSESSIEDAEERRFKLGASVLRTGASTKA